jgi:hypothetical protein
VLDRLPFPISGATHQVAAVRLRMLPRRQSCADRQFFSRYDREVRTRPINLQHTLVASATLGASRVIFADDVSAGSRIAAGTLLVRCESSPEPWAGLIAQPLFSKPVGVLFMAAPIANGTDAWAVVPASPPLRLTIRACLDDRCRECGLPVYRCESEGGQMMSLCAGHLRLRN